jgi:hypothetical protein
MSEDSKPSRADSAQRGSTNPTPPRGKKPSAQAKGGKPGTDPHTLRLVAAAVVSLIIGILLGALIFGGDGDEDVIAASEPSATQLVTPEDLTKEAQSLGRPIYWAGPQGDFDIELQRTAEGNTSVRYIPAGEEADSAGGDFLTVVTYPYPDAHEALTQQAASGEVFSRDLPGGGLTISQPGQPTNAYLAYEGEDYQVEVYDPRPGRALKLVLDGSVVNAG